MRVMQIGNVGIRLTDQAQSAPFSSENDWRKSLESMGHEVVPVHEQSWGGDPAQVAHVAPDMVLWTHTGGWGPAPHMVAAFVAACRERSIPIAGLHLDLWKGLDRANTIATNPYFRSLDVFAQADPDFDWWKERGVNAIYSPPGVLEASCYLAEPVPELAHEITATMARGYHSEHGFRRTLIDWLERTYGTRFKLYEHGSGMREHRLNQLMASAAVVIGDTCHAGKIAGYTSDRLYESTGRGARLVYPRIEGITDDAPVRTFTPENLSEMRAQIEDALAAPEAQRGVERAHAIAWTRANHTYRHRLAALIEALKERKLLRADA